MIDLKFCTFVYAYLIILYNFFYTRTLNNNVVIARRTENKEPTYLARYKLRFKYSNTCHYIINDIEQVRFGVSSNCY